MKSPKPTKGPWIICPDKAAQIVGDMGGKCVAQVYGIAAFMKLAEVEKFYGERFAEGLANARLIAAAPTMYDYVAKHASEGDHEARSILTGIAAAEGSGCTDQ